MAKNIHIVPNGKSGWNVKKEGAATPLSSHRTQAAAESAGRRVAKQADAELVTHRRDGTIRDKDSFGNDPVPPKDQKH